MLATVYDNYVGHHNRVSKIAAAQLRSQTSVNDKTLALEIIDAARGGCNLSAADEMDDLDLIAFRDLCLSPARAAHDFAVAFNRQPLRCELQLGDQIAERCACR